MKRTFTAANSGNTQNKPVASDHRHSDKPIPEDKAERDRILNLVRDYVRSNHITPPPTKEELWKHARRLIQETKLPQRFCDLVKVLINNEIWKSTIASVPFERRLLLLPQCLRSATRCQAEIDEFGLLCEQCGECPLGELQAKAEALGYVVLIAEGTTVVTSLLESGKVDALIGVSCLNVLEKTFPHMVTYAIPGIAIPLTGDGCVNTELDLDWLNGYLHLIQTDDSWIGNQELQQWRDQVNTWFEHEKLTPYLMENSTNTQELAVSWLSGHGKRWRPFLAVLVFKALNGIDKELTDCIRKVAIAVECFHKASLIHDDIEDEDDFRYGEATLHREQGLAIALNIGDLLIGEGYRLIAGCNSTPERIAKMLSCAAAGHHLLCIGQGEELMCGKSPSPPSSDKVIEIFRCKTSPAFEVALSMGAIAAGADDAICTVLNRFSESLGIAYQIQDDIDDFQKCLRDHKVEDIRSSLLLSMALEEADETWQQALLKCWHQQEMGTEVLTIISELNVEEKAKHLAEFYKNEAIRSLATLQNAHLKSLLRKVIGKIIGKQNATSLNPGP